MSARVGVLGGTFDPPHLGHLWLATLARDELALDRVLFMPAADPPHKNAGVSDPRHRLEMTRLAIAGDEGFALSLVDMQRPGPSYTVDSMRTLLGELPGARLFLVMAADSLAQIDSWREPDTLLELVEWAVGPRPGAPAPHELGVVQRFGQRADRIHLLSGPALSVSGTEIRARVAAGRVIRYLVPAAVERYIADHGLYRAELDAADAGGER